MTNNPSFSMIPKETKLQGVLKNGTQTTTNILFFEMSCRWHKRKHTH